MYLQVIKIHMRTLVLVILGMESLFLIKKNCLLVLDSLNLRHHSPSMETQLRVKNLMRPETSVCINEDSFYSSNYDVLSNTGKTEIMCTYDMNMLDINWLRILNERRVEEFGLPAVSEETFELVLGDFETRYLNNYPYTLKTERDLGVAYDEVVICDVCRSPECIAGNEMLFCYSCNIYVHQECYGVTVIPESSWICRPCALKIKPACVLCPNMGGAMKSDIHGEKWAHVSCALWIPEVSIGCPEKMEPIMRISHIPARRARICALCRKRVGLRVQCSAKQCKVSYHVTCAFKHGLKMEMKSNGEGVKMQSFCVKHSIKSSQGTKRKRRELRSTNDPEMIDENNANLQKRSHEAQFSRSLSIENTAEMLNIDYNTVDFLHNYWVLKKTVSMAIVSQDKLQF